MLIRSFSWYKNEASFWLILPVPVTQLWRLIISLRRADEASMALVNRDTNLSRESDYSAMRIEAIP